MSERLIDYWGKTTTDAFGDTPKVRKGYLAERLYHIYAARVYDDVICHEDDQNLQIAGYDFAITQKKWARYYGVDVKGNMKENGIFCIENDPEGWLRNKKKRNDRVVHICTTNGWAVEYDRYQMIELLDTIEEYKDTNLIYVSVFDKKLKETIRRFRIKK